MLVRPRIGACWAVILAVGVCFTISGCGGGTSKVRGKVTQQGKTVVWGSVTLVDQTGMFFQGDIDLNGNYEIDKVVSGPVKIAVASPNPDQGRGGDGGGGAGGRPDPKLKGATAGGRGAPEDPREKFLSEKGAGKAQDGRPRPPAGAWFQIDPKFADPTTSGLTGEVKSGTTELNIDIK